MKVIKLIPNQIILVWDNIKYVVGAVERFSNNDLQLYLSKLLQDLLSSKAQCFIRMDDSRNLLALAITQLSTDLLTGEKTLIVKHLYSFSKVSEIEWRTDMEFIKQFAKLNKCLKIVANTSNSRLTEIMMDIGFSERYRSFCMEV